MSFSLTDVTISRLCAASLLQEPILHPTNLIDFHMNGFQIKGSALSPAVASASGLINKPMTTGDDSNVLIQHGLLHVGTSGCPIEEIINVDKLEFPKLGNGQIPRSEWILKLKLRLKEFGANHYSLYKWPEELIDLVLAYPLATVLEFERKVVERNNSVSPPEEEHTLIKSWEVFDEDKILVPNYLKSSVESQADPLIVLRSMFLTVFTKFPAFKLFFSRQMSTQQIQKQLHDLYVGIWTARAFTQPLIDRSIPANYWSMFSHVKNLAEFFACVKDVEAKMEWQEFRNMFQGFLQVQTLSQQYKKSIRGRSNVDLPAFGIKIKSVLEEMKEFLGLPCEFIQHYMYVQLLESTADKLSRMYENFKVDRFDIERFRSMRPSKLLTKKSTTAILREMRLHALGLPRIKEKLSVSSKSSTTPPVQQKLPPSGPSADLQKQPSKGRTLSEVINTPSSSTLSSPSLSSPGSALPATAPKSMLASVPWRSSSKKSLSRRGNLKWLDPALVSNLKKKITQGTLTQEEREIVNQYSFVFHYELLAKHKRNRDEEANIRSSTNSPYNDVFDDSLTSRIGNN